ncbi:MAG: tRNA lysidine(34) synthetase TilS [Allosphingosinicella sp.]
MEPRGPSPDQVRRFRADLERLAGAAPSRLGIAVSGGPDSLALLLLAHAAGDQPVAATVDHGLRPEGAAEAEFVADICRQHGIPHSVLRPDRPIAGSVQAMARRARYDLLERWRRAQALDWVLTAHHADDQVETVLMRLNRGSGVAGLSGVRSVNARLLRPLLGWRRAELGDIVREAGIAPVEDPSNRDARFDRARLRSHLAEESWIDPIGFARSAEAMAEADAAIEWALDRLVETRCSAIAGGLQIDPADLPRELRRRLLRRGLEQVNPAADPRGDELSRLLATLERGDQATLAGISCRGGESWTFTTAPPRRRKDG